MPYQIIVRQIKPTPAPLPAPEANMATIDSWSEAAKALLRSPASDEIYCQTIESLDLGKLIAAVNGKRRKSPTPKPAK